MWLAQQTPNGARAALGRLLSPSLERRLLDLIVDAFGRWQVSNYRRAGDDELNLTAPLVGKMIEVARERGLPLHFQPEVGEYTKEMLEGRADARIAARVDVSISAGYFAYDLHLVLECKRLGRGATAGQYVRDGLLRFVAGRYASTSNFGAMLAYLMTPTTEIWHSRVNAAIDRTSELTDKDHLHMVTEPAAGVRALESSHNRSGPMPSIRVAHTFLDLSRI